MRFEVVLPVLSQLFERVLKVKLVSSLRAME